MSYDYFLFFLFFISPNESIRKSVIDKGTRKQFEALISRNTGGVHSLKSFRHGDVSHSYDRVYSTLLCACLNESL